MACHGQKHNPWPNPEGFKGLEPCDVDGCVLEGLGGPEGTTCLADGAVGRASAELDGVAEESRSAVLPEKRARTEDSQGWSALRRWT